MKRMARALLLLGMTTGSVLAQPAAPSPRYVRSANYFACETDGENFRSAQAEQRDPCLRIGPLYVGMPRAEAEALLGQPFTSVPVAARQAYGYALARDNSGALSTYAVVMYDERGRVDSVQLTGAGFPPNWTFSGIALGMAEDAMAARMGRPFSTEKSEDRGAVQWSYAPWTFSFEVKAGIVSSIRLAAR